MHLFTLLFCINAILGKQLSIEEPSLEKDKGLIKVKGWPQNKFANFKVNDKIRIYSTSVKKNTVNVEQDGTIVSKPYEKNSKSDVF